MHSRVVFMLESWNRNIFDHRNTNTKPPNGSRVVVVLFWEIHRCSSWHDGSLVGCLALYLVGCLVDSVSTNKRTNLHDKLTTPFLFLLPCDLVLDQ
jgi:hypothetical protein